MAPQWIYDTWWAAMTPDKEFPAELRRIINSMLGEICVRARRLDARSLIIRYHSHTWVPLRPDLRQLAVQPQRAQRHCLS